MTGLSVEDYARLAARHSLRPDQKNHRPERIDNLRPYGVEDEESLVRHIAIVLRADDTICARIANGREYYANDRLNTIVILNTVRPERSTAFHNDNDDVDPSGRLAAIVTEDEIDTGRDFPVRLGGYDALAQDRPAELGRKPRP